MKCGAIDSLPASGLGLKVPWSRIPFACAGHKRVSKCLLVATGSAGRWGVGAAYQGGILDEGQRYRGAC